MSSPVVIRRAVALSPTERDALADLLVAVVGDGASVGFLAPLARADALAYWDRVAAALDRGTILLLAEADDALAGTVQLQPAESANGPHRAEVAKLLVGPACRRRGIGRALMARLEDEARAAGRTLLTLDTRDGDPSNVLYRSLGYAPFGAVPGWTRDAAGRLEATVFYWKDLDTEPGSTG